MSSDIGKERILNPKNLDPIMKERYILLGDEVISRVQQYVSNTVQCSDVFEGFKDIKDEILKFYTELSSEIRKMENEWKGSSDQNVKRGVSYQEESVAPYVAGVIATSPIWFPLMTAAVAIGVVTLPFIAPVVAFLTADSRKKKKIDEEYEKCKSTIQSKICNALESNHGDIMYQLITKVTHDMLHRRIKFIEDTIKELSENREKIIANQESLNRLTEKLRPITRMSEEITQDLYSCRHSC